MRLFTVKELADRWQISPGHLYNTYKNLDIPYTKIGRSVRFRLKDIIEFENSGLDFHPQNDNLGLKGVPMHNKKNGNFNGCINRYKTKKGVRFRLSYYENGKRKQPWAKSETESGAWVELHQRLQEIAESSSRKRERVSFKVFAKEFEKDYLMLERKNWKSDRYRLEKLIDFFRNTPLNEITSLDVRKLKKERLDLGNSPATTNRYLALLKRMFNYAIESELLETNPVKSVKLLSEQDEIHEKILTADEEEKLINECHSRLKPVVVLALNSGMRKSEILKLKWDDVDLFKETIRVQNTKSKKARILPMNDTAKRVFRYLKESRNGDEKVFPFKNIRSAFEGARERAGVPELRFHDLRHTYATRLVESGCDIVLIQKLLGHSTLLVTQRYTHACENRMREAVKRLDCAKVCAKKTEQSEEISVSHSGAVN
jgi:integrase